MEQIQIMLATIMSNPNITEWGVYLVAALAGITLAVAVSYLFSGLYSPVRAQINKLSKKPSSSTDMGKEYESSLEHTIKKLDSIPFINKRYQGDSSAKELLIHAGFHSQGALKIYNAIKLLSLLLGLAIAIFSIRQIPHLSIRAEILIIIAGLSIGYLLPGIILSKLATHRMNDLRKYFPDALDLLVVCCEAGLGLLESFQRVSRELQLSHPNLSFELGLVCSKVRYGLTLQQALQEFSYRTGLEDIKGLNSVIVQSLKLGTGVAATIRVYADEYREKRLQRAEEQAAKLGVKMIFPMMCCIWPSFFIVAIGPAVLNVIRVWDKAF
ncbi:MAG: tight adherence protein C [Moritella dasanensis]|jgi:tight adherence protein C